MISGEALILAAGSKAAAKLGSDGSGYDLAKMLGHKLVPVVPALVQLRCREKLLIYGGHKRGDQQYREKPANLSFTRLPMEYL